MFVIVLKLSGIQIQIVPRFGMGNSINMYLRLTLNKYQNNNYLIRKCIVLKKNRTVSWGCFSQTKCEKDGLE
jgi:hypothetical protein